MVPSLYRRGAQADQVTGLLERPPIDWTQPIQWNTGEPAQAERSYGYVIITFDEDHPCPEQIEPWLQQKHFKDSLIVYEDTGYCMGWECYDAWIENVNATPHPLAALEGAF